MFKILSLSVAVLFFGMFAGTAMAQDNPTTPPKTETPKTEPSQLLATWTVVFAAPDKDYPGTLKIEKDGEGFKGSVTTELGEAPLSGLKVTGDSFTAMMTVNVQGQAIDGTIEGKVTAGKVAGGLSLSGVGDIPFSGTKK